MWTPKLWFLENRTTKTSKLSKTYGTQCVAGSETYETLDVLIDGLA